MMDTITQFNTETVWTVPESYHRNLNTELLEKCANTRCRDCITVCPIKKYNVSVDKRICCTIPDAKLKADMHGTSVITPECLEKMSFDIMEKMSGLCESVRDLKTMHDVILNYKHEFYPNVQKNVNVNLDVMNTSDEILANVFKNSMLQEKSQMELDVEKKLKQQLLDEGIITEDEPMIEQPAEDIKHDD